MAMFKEIREFFGNRAHPSGDAPPDAPAKSVGSEERPFFEGKRDDGPAEAGAAPAEQTATPSDAPSQKSSSSPHSPLEQRIIDEALKKCYDPEIPVDIWELGLIYSISASPSGVVDVKMTLTAPGCPVAGSLPGEVEQKIKAVEGVTDARVEIVWDPPWNTDMMSRVARVMLGM